MTPHTTWGIKRERNGRYVLYNTTSGDVMDDAQGYGFESYYKEYNYGYNKYHNGGNCNGMPNIDELNTLL